MLRFLQCASHHAHAHFMTAQASTAVFTNHPRKNAKNQESKAEMLAFLPSCQTHCQCALPRCSRVHWPQPVRVFRFGANTVIHNQDLEGWEPEKGRGGGLI